MELPQGPRTQTTDAPPKQRATSFFPLRKLKGNQPTQKTPAVCLAHLEEEEAGGNEDQESDNPSRIRGVTEEFMVSLARAVKDAHVDEKCCYHCSILELFIHNCLLVKSLREMKQLNGKEGMTKKEAQPLWQQPMHQRAPRQRFSRSNAPQLTPFLNLDPFHY